MTWITDTVTELKLRTTAALAPQPSVVMPTQHNTPELTIPKASGKQRTIWGKKLAGMVFGSDADRHGNHDTTTTEGQEQAARLLAARAAIDEQITRGTAAKVSIPSKGGRQLDGNFFSAEGHNLRNANNNAPDTTRPVVLFLSGSGGTAEGYGTEIAEFYQESGASMLAVNFGGYGGSTGGAPTEQSLLEDGQAMLKHLLDLGYTEDQIIMHGFSMGGAVAGKLQAHNEKNGMKLRGLMLDRPMVSVSGGVQAHGYDAVDEATEDMPGGVKPVLNTLGKGAVKVVSAITRQSTGTMSARKALTKKHSDTAVIVSGDQGRFAAQGAALRAKLQTRDPTRSVGGAASGAGHMEADPMIAQNDQAMLAMIATPPQGARPQVQFASGLSAAEKASTRKLRAAVNRRVQQIKDEVKRAEDDITRLQMLIATSATPLPANIANHVSSKVVQVRAAIAQVFTDTNEFARTLDPTLEPIASSDIANQRKKLRQIEKNLNAVAETAGVAPTYGADVIEAEVAHAIKMLSDYNAMPPVARTGTSYCEQQLIASTSLFAKMANPGGVVFAGNDDQVVRDVRDAAGDIQMVIARARRAMPQPPQPQARTALTDSGAMKPKRKEREKLRASLS
jgi:dienelactone hydrolase